MEEEKPLSLKRKRNEAKLSSILSLKAINLSDSISRVKYQNVMLYSLVKMLKMKLNTLKQNESSFKNIKTKLIQLYSTILNYTETILSSLSSIPSISTSLPNFLLLLSLLNSTDLTFNNPLERFNEVNFNSISSEIKSYFNSFISKISNLTSSSSTPSVDNMKSNLEKYLLERNKENRQSVLENENKSLKIEIENLNNNLMMITNRLNQYRSLKYLTKTSIDSKEEKREGGDKVKRRKVDNVDGDKQKDEENEEAKERDIEKEINLIRVEEINKLKEKVILKEKEIEVMNNKLIKYNLSIEEKNEKVIKEIKNDDNKEEELDNLKVEFLKVIHEKEDLKKENVIIENKIKSLIKDIKFKYSIEEDNLKNNLKFKINEFNDINTKYKLLKIKYSKLDNFYSLEQQAKNSLKNKNILFKTLINKLKNITSSTETSGSGGGENDLFEEITTLSNSLEKESKLLRDTIKQKKQLKGEIEKLLKKLKQTEKSNEKIRIEKEEKEKEIEELKQSLIKLNEKCNILNKEIKQSEQVIQKQEQFVEEEIKKKAKMKRELERVESELQRTKDEKEKEEREKEELKQRNIEIKENYYNDEYEKNRKKEEKLKNEGEGDQGEEAEFYKKILRCPVKPTLWKTVMITRCSHMFAKETIDETLSSRNRKCPTCKKSFSRDDVVQIYLYPINKR